MQLVSLARFGAETRMDYNSCAGKPRARRLRWLRAQRPSALRGRACGDFAQCHCSARAAVRGGSTKRRGRRSLLRRACSRWVDVRRHSLWRARRPMLRLSGVRVLYSLDNDPAFLSLGIHPRPVESLRVAGRKLARILSPGSSWCACPARGGACLAATSKALRNASHSAWAAGSTMRARLGNACG